MTKREQVIEELADYAAGFLSQPGPHEWVDFADGLLCIVELYLVKEVEGWSPPTRH